MNRAALPRPIDTEKHDVDDFVAETYMDYDGQHIAVVRIPDGVLAQGEGSTKELALASLQAALTELYAKWQKDTE